MAAFARDEPARSLLEALFEGRLAAFDLVADGVRFRQAPLPQQGAASGMAARS